ncbi:Lysozyme M1 precursor [Enhygromyxa salina]|uniref:Lysozyme M1 n=1 Tax=Enhygromyxa salina TaxID=215803 RepID=A0A2S9YBP4_9BACT|nr:glycoside hydrolase family 25 protein [Enhygromyxa salina]PRQ02523.1 Lysozyme M1 precursor [Enhygromyxa salina]
MGDWIQGLDIAQYQPNTDFSAVSDGGFRFVFAKATEGAKSRGGGYVDPTFRDNWAKLVALDPRKRGGLYRGAYHFARPDHSKRGCGRAAGVAEAQWFCEVLKKVGDCREGCLPPVLDYEKSNNCSPADNAKWIRGFLDTIQHELGRPGMLYTGPKVWRSQLGGCADFIDELLWVVTWSKSKPEPAPMPVGADWPWTFWQWSAGGSNNYYGQVPGVMNKDCDIDRFSGDEAALAALALLGDRTQGATTGAGR